MLNWEELLFNPNAFMQPTPPVTPGSWTPTLEPVRPPQLTPAPTPTPQPEPPAWAALNSGSPALSAGFPLSSPSPAEDYDPFKAFAPAKAPEAKKPGLLGNSFGMMGPEDQQAWLTGQFADYETGTARIKSLEEAIAKQASPYGKRALGAQLNAARAALPDINRLNAMKGGSAPLPTKTGIRAGVENAPRGFADAVLGIPEMVGIVKGYLGDEKVDDNSILQWSLNAKKYVAEQFPGDEARQADFSQQLANGAGQLGAFYGGGALAGLAKLGAKGVAAVVALMGGSATGSQGFEEATVKLKEAQAEAARTGDKATVDEIDRILQTFGYAAVGLTEAIPVAKTFSRLAPNPATGVGRRAVGAAEGALEEGLQEGASQAAQNAIAAQTTDPARPLGQGVAESMAVGAVLGGGAGGAFVGRAPREPRIESIDPFVEPPEIRPGEPLSFVDLMPGEGYTSVEPARALSAPRVALPAPEAGDAATVRPGGPQPLPGSLEDLTAAGADAAAGPKVALTTTPIGDLNLKNMENRLSWVKKSLRASLIQSAIEMVRIAGSPEAAAEMFDIPYGWEEGFGTALSAIREELNDRAGTEDAKKLRDLEQSAKVREKLQREAVRDVQDSILASGLLEANGMRPTAANAKAYAMQIVHGYSHSSAQFLRDWVEQNKASLEPAINTFQQWDPGPHRQQLREALPDISFPRKPYVKTEASYFDTVPTPTRRDVSSGDADAAAGPKTPLAADEYYHGGSYQDGDIDGVLYLTKNPQFADTYVQMANERGIENAARQRVKASLQNAAPVDVVRQMAANAGVETESSTPASWFDKELHGEQPIKLLKQQLQRAGYDHAVLPDVSYGGGMQEDVTVAFPAPGQKVVWGAAVTPPKQSAQKARPSLPEQPFKAVGKPAEGTARQVELSAKLTRDQAVTQGKILLDAGRTVRVPTELQGAAMKAIASVAGQLPANTRAGALSRIEPAGFDEGGKPLIRAVFTLHGGGEQGLITDWKELTELRALYIGAPAGNGVILLPLLDPAESGRDRLRAVLRHEIVHALRRQGNIPGGDFNRLLGHATDLRVFDMEYAAFAKATKDPYAADYVDGVTIRQFYAELYKGRPDFDERMAQEAVAHMIELAAHGALGAEALAPVQGVLANMESGAYREPVAAAIPQSKGGGDAAAKPGKGVSIKDVVRYVKGGPAESTIQNILEMDEDDGGQVTPAGLASALEEMFDDPELMGIDPEDDPEQMQILGHVLVALKGGDPLPATGAVAPEPKKPSGDVFSAIDAAPKAFGANEVATDILKDLGKIWKKDYPWAGWAGLSGTKEFKVAFRTALKAKAAKLNPKTEQGLLAGLFDIVQKIDAKRGPTISELPGAPSAANVPMDPMKKDQIVGNVISTIAEKVANEGGQVFDFWQAVTEDALWKGDSIEYAHSLIHGLQKAKSKVSTVPGGATYGALNQIKEQLENALMSVGVTAKEIYGAPKLVINEEPATPNAQVVKALMSAKDAPQQLSNAISMASSMATEAGGPVLESFKWAVGEATLKIDPSVDFIGWAQALQKELMFAQGGAMSAKAQQKVGAMATLILNGLAARSASAKKAGPKPAVEWTDAEIDALTDKDFKSAHFSNVLIAIPESLGSSSTQDFKYWAVDEAKKMAKAAGQSSMKPAFIKVIIDQAKALKKLKGEASQQAASDLADLAQKLLPGSVVKTEIKPQALSLAAAKLVAKNMGMDAAAALEEAIAANKSPNAMEAIVLSNVAQQLGVHVLTHQNNMYPELADNLKKLVQGLFAGADNLAKGGTSPYSAPPAAQKAPKYTIDDALLEAGDSTAGATLEQLFNTLTENSEGGVVLPGDLAEAIEGVLEVEDGGDDPEQSALLKEIADKLNGKTPPANALQKKTIAAILANPPTKQYPTAAAVLNAGIPPSYSTAKSIISETGTLLYQNIPAFKQAGPYPAVAGTAEFKAALVEQLKKTIDDNIAQGNDTVAENIAVFIAALDPKARPKEESKGPPAPPKGLTFDDLIPAPKKKFTFVSNAGGGSKPKEIWQDEDGNEYMFKPVPKDAQFLAYGEAAGGHISRLINPQAPRIWVQELNGRLGSMQEMLPNSGTLRGTDIADLTFEEAQAIQREHVVDWLISNHDGHDNQFLILKGGKIVGIDKGQAFKYFGKDRLAIDYHPNAVYNEKEPIYNTFWRAYSKGELTKVKKRLEEDYVDDLAKLDERFAPLQKYVDELNEQADKKTKEFSEFYEQLKIEASKLTQNYDLVPDLSAAVQGLEDGFLDAVRKVATLKEGEYWTTSKQANSGAFFISRSADYVTAGEHSPVLLKVRGAPLNKGISVEDAQKLLGVEDLDNGQRLVVGVWGLSARPLADALVKAGYDHVTLHPDWAEGKGGAIVLTSPQPENLTPWKSELAPLAEEHFKDIMQASQTYISAALRTLAKQFLKGGASQRVLDDAQDIEVLEPPYKGMSSFEYINEYNQERNPLASILQHWADNTNYYLDGRYEDLKQGYVIPGSRGQLWSVIQDGASHTLVSNVPQYFTDMRDKYAPEGELTKKGLEKLYALRNTKRTEFNLLKQERDELTQRGQEIMFRAPNEAIAALQQSLSTADFLSILRPYAQGRWPKNPTAVDAFLDYARQRKENLGAKFHRFFIELDDRRKRGAKALKEDDSASDGDYSSQVKSFNKQNNTDLTPDEYSAIHNYTNSAFRKLNLNLREDIPVDKDKMTVSKDWLRSMEYATLLEAALEKLPPYLGEVYRGQDITQAELDLIYPGRVLHTKYFFSTSRTSGFGGKVRFVIKSLTGRNVEDLSGHSSEREVLFAPNRNFLVKYIDPDGDYKGNRVTEIHVDELPEVDFNDLR